MRIDNRRQFVRLEKKSSRGLREKQNQKELFLFVRRIHDRVIKKKEVKKKNKFQKGEKKGNQKLLFFKVQNQTLPKIEIVI